MNAQCSDTDTNEACKQAFLTQNGHPFQPLSDQQFFITYPADNFNVYTMMSTEAQFVACLSLAELALISDSFNIQTTNNNTRDPDNYIIKHQLYDNPTYIMTARVRFFGNSSLVENAIHENIAGKPCGKKLPEPQVLGVSVTDVIYYFLTVGTGIVVSGSLLVILCGIMMDECSKKSNSEQEMAPLMQIRPML